MRWAVAVGSLALLAQPVSGQSKAKEVVDFVVKKFGASAVKDGAAALAGKIETSAARHGEEVYQAVKKVGPSAFHLLEHAGPHGKTAAQVLAKHGNQGVILAARPQALTLVARHGDDAAVVILKHPGIAEPIIEGFGKPGIQALASLSHQNARRLAMLVQDGSLARNGKMDELLGVVGRIGDRAMNFVWDHKGALAITAVLTAFVAEPEAFIDGARDIAKIAGDSVARPLAEAPGKVAVEVARQTNWTIVILVAVAVTALGLKLRSCRKRSK